MLEYALKHIGINCENQEEARKAAALFETMFGMTAKEGDISVFASTTIECMKIPYYGKNGHIAIGTPDVAAAIKDLESRGFAFNYASLNYKPDGSVNTIYFADEICGFAIHLVGSK